jgi:alcohol dehydrogenase
VTQWPLSARCQGIVAPGGHIASIGVFGKSVNLEIQRLWAHNITLRTRLVDTVSTPMLLKTVVAGKLQPSKLITHRFQTAGYHIGLRHLQKSSHTKALKVVLQVN